MVFYHCALVVLCSLAGTSRENASVNSRDISEQGPDRGTSRLDFIDIGEINFTGGAKEISIGGWELSMVEGRIQGDFKNSRQYKITDVFVRIECTSGCNCPTSGTGTISGNPTGSSFDFANGKVKGLFNPPLMPTIGGRHFDAQVSVPQNPCTNVKFVFTPSSQVIEVSPASHQDDVGNYLFTATTVEIGNLNSHPGNPGAICTVKNAYDSEPAKAINQIGGTVDLTDGEEIVQIDQVYLMEFTLNEFHAISSSISISDNSFTISGFSLSVGGVYFVAILFEEVPENRYTVRLTATFESE